MSSFALLLRQAKYTHFGYYWIWKLYLEPQVFVFFICMTLSEVAYL